jgi:aminomethyltransferase
MPVTFKGILEEHQAVRQRAGVFDISHMARIEIRGAGAERFLNRVATNDIARLETGQLLYSPLCLPSGGVVDDVTIYRRGPERFLMVANASNAGTVLDWLAEQAMPGADVEDLSDRLAQLALQGPRAEEVLLSEVGPELRGLGYYRFLEGSIAGVRGMISRNGYTGEDGFEIYFPASGAGDVIARIFELGGPVGIEPIGLGARDTLRFEMAYCLYGHELTRETSPLEAGLGWTIKFGKPGGFVGEEVLARQKSEGLRRRLVGLEPLGEGRIPRPGCSVVHGEERIGEVTSGTFAPSLGKPLALAFVASSFAKEGTDVGIDIRGAAVPARVVKRPFYTHGSHR